MVAKMSQLTLKKIGDQSWKIGENGWALKDVSGVDFKNLLKAREAKYGWKFAEKCDWEPMDEIYIFAKSNIRRVDDAWIEDPQNKGSKIFKKGTGAYSMLPIFFGYIDSVNKTFQAGKGGLIMNIQASDHLKLLDLSYVTNYPSILPGVSNGGAIDIRWAQDKFGNFLIHEPFYNIGKSEKGSSAEKANQYDNAIVS